MKALIWIFFFTTLIPSIFILPTCLAASNAVDVEATREIVVTPNGQSQVQLGGTVPYSHVITNNSNQTEFIQLAATNSLPGWSVVLGVDTNNNGSYTTHSTLSLQSGESLNMQATVRAPSNALLGAVNGTIITITTTDYLSISVVVDQTTVSHIYGVDATDTDTGTAPGVNDGGDDDSSANDSQYVDVAAAGAELLFQHVITNNGSGDDAFNLGVTSDATDGFPPGTVFTYWNSTGTVQLTDTDNDGFPDTGILPPDASETIMAKASLPAGVSGAPANAYNATLTATSAMDSSATPAADPTALKLGAITPPTVDIANVTADQGATVADGFNDNGVSNAQDEAPVVLAAGAVNSVVTFDLQLANESVNPDSFLLSSGNVPAGWDVVFKDAAAGNVITTTPLVPGGGVFLYTAEVTISSDPAEALSNSDQAGAVDGYDAVNDSASALTLIDGDLDYQMNFIAESTSISGVSDSVTNAVDVEAVRDVVITPNGQNQVPPRGTVEYSHKLENNGNQDETVEMDVTNTQPGWTTVVNVDTGGDGVPDTILTSALAGTTISGIVEAGNPVQIEVTDTDGDGIPELHLEPGENVNMTTNVTAPSSAPLGAVDASTISVTEIDDTPLTSAQNQTFVIFGQVRLEKRAAIDTDCDGAPETGFLATQTTQVEPEQCIVWKLTATNEGTATVKNVVISDAAPAFTDVVTGMLKFCHGNACTPTAATDASDTDKGTYATGLVKFFADQLTPGEQMTGEFIVKVNTHTAAGTLIKNLATVTYEDENHNSYSAQSNEAVTTVAPVHSLPTPTALMTYEDVPVSPIAFDSTTACTGTRIQRTINVPDELTVNDLLFGFTAAHSYRGDIYVTITSPNSTRVTAIDRSYDSYNNYDVLLSDSQTLPLENEYDDNTTAPFYERGATPSRDLSAFNGEIATGDWLITICDPLDSQGSGYYHRSALKFPAPDFDGDDIPDLTDLDDDNDGMPDTWEQLYGFNPFLSSDALLDQDSDNISNLNEYIQGSNPLISDNNSPNIIPIILYYLLDSADE